MKRSTLEHQFVKSIPKPMAEGVLYVSMEFSTVGHKCCCGCDNEVFTRLSPKDWQLSYDGRSISLYPSVGNWNFPCQSHYWIENDQIVWDRKWSKAKIDALRREAAMEDEHREERPPKRKSWWQRIKGQ